MFILSKLKPYMLSHDVSHMFPTISLQTTTTWNFFVQSTSQLLGRNSVTVRPQIRPSKCKPMAFSSCCSCRTLSPPADGTFLQVRAPKHNGILHKTKGKSAGEKVKDDQSQGSHEEIPWGPRYLNPGGCVKPRLHFGHRFSARPVPLAAESAAWCSTSQPRSPE